MLSLLRPRSRQTSAIAAADKILDLKYLDFEEKAVRGRSAITEPDLVWPAHHGIPHQWFSETKSEKEIRQGGNLNEQLRGHLMGDLREGEI